MLKIQRGPWKVDLAFDGTALHVRPRADARWHPLAEDCHCIPTQNTAEVHDSDGDPVTLPVYFHTALDGREEPAPRPGCPGEPA
jgi:hypothetical protein